MPPTVSQLIAALPEGEDDPTTTDLPELPQSLAQVSQRPIPVGRFRRLTVLGTLQAKIGAAYLFYWLRGWFRKGRQQELQLAETHWRTAVRLLDSMSYLRGAVMKVGQTLANFPDIAPREFVETLEQLHFNAPPMHWSLLREMVHNELGNDPENVFAQFDKRAFAAASLGQVHRARLDNGDELAVKIQYPGIARSIQVDFRNFLLFLLPARLNRDWDNTRDQFDDLRRRLELETDYEQEAAHLAAARSLFRDSDGIVIPRVYPEFSTARVLAMERIEGVHLTEFMDRNPSEAERNEIARKILTAWYRMMYSGRVLYADLHPGNFLVMDDGRLGVLDFGFVMPIDDDEWERFRRIDRPLTTGRREDRVPVLKEWNDLTGQDTHQLAMCDAFAEWCWSSRWHDGLYDFSNEDDFRRGVDIFTEMVRKRYTRSRPNTPVISRCHFGWRSIFYLLKAKLDVRAVAEQEIKATGWDRSAYT